MTGLTTHLTQSRANELKCPIFGNQTSSNAEWMAEESAFFEMFSMKTTLPKELSANKIR
jgi:hypothetical protein